MTKYDVNLIKPKEFYYNYLTNATLRSRLSVPHKSYHGRERAFNTDTKLKCLIFLQRGFSRQTPRKNVLERDSENRN